MFGPILKLITTCDERRPSTALAPELDGLFLQLRAAPDPASASQIEELIWRYWMDHSDPEASAQLDRATRAIGADRHDEAAQLLDQIIAAHPDFAEAWNKRATLKFLIDRPAESLADINSTLLLEPRHFGAICGFGQICLRRGERDSALFAFDVALRINPHLEGIRNARDQLLRRGPPTAH